MKKEWIEPIIETLKVESTEGDRLALGNDGVTYQANNNTTGNFGS